MLATSVLVEILRYFLHTKDYPDKGLIGVVVAGCVGLNIIFHLWDAGNSDWKTGLSAFYNQATLPYSVAALFAAGKLFLKGTIPAPPPF